MHRQSLYFVNEKEVGIRQDTIPTPAANQILVRSLLSAISSGTEMLAYRGQVPEDMVLDETIGDLEGMFRYPFQYGYAVVGQVIAIGADVSSQWLHQQIFSFHPHESHFVTTPESVIPVSDMVAEDVLFLPNMESAVNFVMDGRPLIGERVVVFGQGIVGLLTAALLAQCPLDDLITVDAYPMRRKISQALGVSHCLDPMDSEAFAAPFPASQQIAGADLLYELSGNPHALNQAITFAGFGSRIVVGSWYGTKSAALDLGGAFHRQRIRLISSQVSTLAPELCGRWTKSRRLDLAMRQVKQIQPARFITHRFPIHEAAQAYELLDQQPQEALQVILTY